MPATTGRAQVVVPLRQAPRSITVNGHALPHAADATALRTAGDGWAFASGPFGGVVLTLTAQGRPADVTIR